MGLDPVGRLVVDGTDIDQVLEALEDALHGGEPLVDSAKKRPWQNPGRRAADVGCGLPATAEWHRCGAATETFSGLHRSR